MSEKESSEKTIRNIRRQTRKKYSAEEKIRIVLDGLRGDETIADYADEKVSVLASIINGQKNSWRLEC